MSLAARCAARLVDGLVGRLPIAVDSSAPDGLELEDLDNLCWLLAKAQRQATHWPISHRLFSGPVPSFGRPPWLAHWGQEFHKPFAMQTCAHARIRIELVQDAVRLGHERVLAAAGRSGPALD